MSDRSPELSVLIMAYNEQGGLEVTTRNLMLVLEGIDIEVVIIDDGSKDGTAEIAQRLESEFPNVHHLRHPVNLGLGGVYRSGFEAARGEWLTFLPADGELPAENLLRFLPHRANHDLLIGTIPNRKAAWLAHVLTFCEKLLHRLLFLKTPPFQGLFMVRRSALRGTRLRSCGRGWGVVIELFLRLLRDQRPWRNVETVLRPRLGGESKVRNLSTIAENVIGLLYVRYYLWLR